MSKARGRSLVRFSTIMEALRYADYDLNSGLGELVDNSVESEASSVWVYTKTEKEGRRESISEFVVIDNGYGMDDEILSKALVLGENARVQTRKPIGRFGVGLTLGGISLARRIDVYSRHEKDKPFSWTYLDLDEVKNEQQIEIPLPVSKSPPSEYENHLKGSSGTIVVLSRCDRVTGDANTLVAEMAKYLGRTYRKFIADSLKVYLNGKTVYLHDPLYLMRPTRFHVIDPKELVATQVGQDETITLDVPGQPGKTARVIIRMSLLPKQWRPYRGSGGTQFAKDRHVDENQGISVLRANREVLYGHVPYIIGQRGQSTSEYIDRWWGCEISFPPELDDFFEVRYIKRGAQPVPSLRGKINRIISPVVRELRNRISTEMAKSQKAQETEKGVFHKAETAMAAADQTLPVGKRGSTVTPEEASRQVTQIVEKMQEADPSLEEKREEKHRELETKPYAIAPVSYPDSVLFEPVHLLGRVIVKLNVNHPFYKRVFEPLCGSIAEMDEDSDVYSGAETREKRLARDALILILLSYAKAESFFDDKADLFENLRMQWGISLKAALSRLPDME